jgi:hypothetical protein
MKTLAFAIASLLAAPAIACPGHDVETPKTAENPAPSRTADKAKPAEQPAKKTEEPKKTDAKSDSSKKPDKVSVR